VFALDDPVIHPTPQKHVTKIDNRWMSGSSPIKSGTGVRA
jgi:hypothetical protein